MASTKCPKCHSYAPEMGTTKFPWVKSMPLSVIDPNANDDEFYRERKNTPLCSLCRAELAGKTPSYTGSRSAGAASRFEGMPRGTAPKYIPLPMGALERSRLEYLGVVVEEPVNALSALERMGI